MEAHAQTLMEDLAVAAKLDTLEPTAHKILMNAKPQQTHARMAEVALTQMVDLLVVARLALPEVIVLKT
jgi:hypothetical protein